MTTKTVKVFEVVYDTDGEGPTGDGTQIARFKDRRVAETFASANTFCGGSARVTEDDVPVRLARRWGLA